MSPERVELPKKTIPSPEDNQKDLRAFVTTIIETMRKYEPLDYPEGDEKARVVGSKVPNSFFEYNKRKILAQTSYDIENGNLFIRAVNEDGSELRDAVKETDYWGWEVVGTENIAAEEKKLRASGIYHYSSGHGGKATFAVFEEKFIPVDSAEKYSIVKGTQKTEKTVLRMEIQVSGDRDPACVYAENNLGEDDFNFSPEKFKDILRQVSEHMVPYVENPELHITLAQVEDRLKPGRYSTVGFLAEEERLFDVIDADTQTLERNGVTFDDIAERIEYLFNTAQENGQEVLIGESHFKVEWLQTRGFQHDPWGQLNAWHAHETRSPTSKRYEQFGFLGNKYKAGGSRDYKITNLKTGKTISLPEMAPHLIGDNHFFEGKTAYRIDPQLVIDILEITGSKKTQAT